MASDESAECRRCETELSGDDLTYRVLYGRFHHAAVGNVSEKQMARPGEELDPGVDERYYCFDCYREEFKREAAAHFEYETADELWQILEAADGRLVADARPMTTGGREWHGGKRSTSNESTSVFTDGYRISVPFAYADLQLGAYFGDPVDGDTEDFDDSEFEWVQAADNAYIWTPYVEIRSESSDFGTEPDDVPGSIPPETWRASAWTVTREESPEVTAFDRIRRVADVLSDRFTGWNKDDVRVHVARDGLWKVSGLRGTESVFRLVVRRRDPRQVDVRYLSLTTSPDVSRRSHSRRASRERPSPFFVKKTITPFPPVKSIGEVAAA